MLSSASSIPESAKIASAFRSARTSLKIMFINKIKIVTPYSTISVTNCSILTFASFNSFASASRAAVSETLIVPSSFSISSNLKPIFFKYPNKN